MESDRMKLWLALQFSLLGLQLLAGMAVNLWVTIPSNHPGAHSAHYFLGILTGIPWIFFHGGILVAIHLVAGALLWIFGIGLAIWGWRTGDRRLFVWLLVAWIGLTGAGFNGGSFVNYGHDVSSFLMTVGWLLAAIGFNVAWYQVGRHSNG